MIDTRAILVSGDSRHLAGLAAVLVRLGAVEIVGADLSDAPDETCLGRYQDGRLFDIVRLGAELPDFAERELIGAREAPELADVFAYADRTSRRTHPTSPKATMRAERGGRGKRHKKARKR